MATVKRSPNGKKWRARWYDPSGKECAKDFDLKRDANWHAADMEASKARGQYIDPHDKTTVTEYAWQWAESRPHKSRTARRTASTIENHIAATTLGPRRVAIVKPSVAQAWATGRSKVLEPSTLRLVVQTTSSIFRAAVRDNLIGTNPFVGLSLPDAVAVRLVPLTVEQARRAAAASPEHTEAMVVTQAGLGLRIGELLALRVQDVDFLRRVVRVEFQIPPNERERDEPKTVLSKRTIPLPQFVADALAAHIAGHPPLADGSLFYNSVGNLWTTSHYARVFAKAAARAGLAEGTTSHDLRHHFASTLLDQGLSVVAVAELLGHKDATLVIKTYGHLVPGGEERARKAIELAWADADQVRTSGSSKAV
jgi:integrase